MTAFLIVSAILIFFVVFGRSGASSIAKSGIPARGILLQVSNVSAGTGGTNYLMRQVRLDIEVPGETPYEISTTVYIASNLISDVLPGAQVALRLSKKDRKKIVIVGPGVSFSAASLATQGQL